jgi:hypothetical protein
MGMSATMTKKRASALLGATALSAVVLLGVTATPSMALGKNGLSSCRSLGGTVVGGDACKFNGPWRSTREGTIGDHDAIRGNCNWVKEAGFSMTVTDGIEVGSGNRARAVVICE